MVFVGGLSRSGKSSLIDVFSTAEGFSHIKASSLLKGAGRPLGPLSKTEAAKNQNVLLELLIAGGYINRQKAILDGHAIIETTEGIFAVPDLLFDEIKPTKMICIVNDAPTIANRRVAAGWHFEPQDISRLQEVELRYARSQANRLHVPFYEIKADDLSDFSRSILDA
jgi:adenylate kinase